MSQGWNAQWEPWKALGSTVHLDRWAWVGWSGQAQGRLWGEVGKNRPLLACRGWEGLGVSTGTLCPHIWPFHQSRG